MSDLKRAVGNRITELCKERNISITTLSIDAGITSSMIRDILNPVKKTVGLKTVKIICDGFDITLGEFFSSKEFDELEQEIK
jgi:transcriptional regulator with XRE-family HTH domain